MVPLLLFFTSACIAQTPSPSPEAFVLPPFQPLRYEEDYEYLKDESKRRERLDSLKYIPVGKPGWYLSIGGEARITYETYRNASFGSGPQDGNGYLLQRYLLHTDWHFGNKYRVFAQLQVGLIANRNGGACPTDKDVLDIHQAFGDYQVFSNEKNSLIIRVGRQEFDFGAGRLISTSDSLNIRRTFDGIRTIYKRGDWTMNSHFAKLVDIRPGVFDDRAVHNQTFWGGAAIRVRKKAQGGLAIYYLGIDYKEARFDQGRAREIRHTFGGRIWGVVKQFDYNYEAIGQTGSFGSGDIRAFAVSTDTGFNLSKLTFRPRLGLQASVASGDRNPRDADLQSFNPLYNRGTAYSGAIALVGPTNLADLTPSLRLVLSKKAKVLLYTSFYRRQSLNDGLYIGSNLQRVGSLSKERFVGGTSSAQLDFQIDRHLAYRAVCSYFFAGRFLKETPPGKDVSYFSTRVTFTF